MINKTAAGGGEDWKESGGIADRPVHGWTAGGAIRCLLAMHMKRQRPKIHRRMHRDQFIYSERLEMEERCQTTTVTSRFPR